MKTAFYLGMCAIYATASAVDAHAAKYVLTATGTVSTITSYYLSNPTNNPPTVIKIGDPFKVVARFDTAASTLSPTFDLDPKINIYWLSGTSVSVNIGGYASTFGPPDYTGSSSIQIWNNNSSGSTDAQGWSFYDYPTEGPYPFDLPGPRKQENISLNLFDNTGSARSHDLISYIAPVSAFNYRSLSYSFNSYNSSGGDQRFNLVDMSNVVVTLTPVPEPEIWGLMIVGFALIGGEWRSRLRKAALAVSYSYYREM